MGFKKAIIKAVSLIVILLSVTVVIGACRNRQLRETAGQAKIPPETSGQTSTPSALSNQTDKSLASAKPDTPKSGILIGIEYAMPGMAKDFAALGVPAVKYYPDGFSWGKTQVSKDAPGDFSPIDRYISEYQDAGYKELVIALKSASVWASKNILNNYSPKSGYMVEYEDWIGKIVERYDMDGTDDMPGLKAPVRYYEIGTEFSSYEPEPAVDYIDMLGHAYKAAHAASDKVVIMNAAFLATTAFKNHPKPEQYAAAFNAVDKRIMKHSLSDIRKILDRPDIFDAVDFHALGDQYEIEDTVNWLNYEMKLRGYTKRIVIGDTAISPLIGWGAATIDKGSQMGIIVPPAEEKDRSRLAKYFQSLVDGDMSAVEWTQSFAASDMVEKVVISAEQGVALINTAFMEELYLFKLKSFKASAGASAWGGMALTKIDAPDPERTIVKLHPLFYALKQLVQHINGYSSIERVALSDNRIRLYRIVKNNKTSWIAWLDPGKLVLWNDVVPQKLLSFKADNTNIAVESMISKPGQTIPVQYTAKTKKGVAEIIITPTPVFIFDFTQ
ncbi:MAG: hypothetical protein FIA99_02800 [Ruminiclostridium sp.]|nr:hypothetical protein [Ruminiclostridium sp.]